MSNQIGNRVSGWLDAALEIVDNGSYANQLVRGIAGSQAFRRYDWLLDILTTNGSGNFHGVVISANWRAVFLQTSKIDDYLGNMSLFGQFAAGIRESAPELDAVVHSSDSISVKGLRIASITGTAAQRALLGGVAGGVHTIYSSLEVACRAVGLAGGSIHQASMQCVGTVRFADTLVQSTFKTVTDTQNQSKAIWWVVDTVLAPRHQ